jgi:hypothetical protein
VNKCVTILNFSHFTEFSSDSITRKRKEKLGGPDDIFYRMIRLNTAELSYFSSAIIQLLLQKWKS